MRGVSKPFYIAAGNRPDLKVRLPLGLSRLLHNLNTDVGTTSRGDVFTGTDLMSISTSEAIQVIES